MGPRDVKLLTGTRLGGSAIRAPKEKLSRIRSGIHKLRSEQMSAEEQVRFVNGLVAQLRYIERLNNADVHTLASQLLTVANPKFVSGTTLKFLRDSASKSKSVSPRQSF